MVAVALAVVPFDSVIAILQFINQTFLHSWFFGKSFNHIYKFF